MKINTMKDTLKNQETIYGQSNEHPHKHQLANTTIYHQTSHQGHVFNTTVEWVEKKSWPGLPDGPNLK